MKITKIELENFYSIKSQTLRLADFEGIIFIEGKNKDTGGSNGAGKSLIIEAVVYGLFGRTLRKSTEDAMVNTDTGKNLSVTLYSDEYDLVIKRTRRPTSLKASFKGNDITKENANATQAEINRVLGTDFKTFAASIAFGQHVNIDFLSAPAEDKRSIIKHFLSLDDLFEWRDRIRPIKAEYKNKASVASALIESLSAEQDQIQRELEQCKDSVEIPSVSLEDVLADEKKVRDFEKTYSFVGVELKEVKLKYNTIKYKLDQGVYTRIEKCNACQQSVEKTQTKEDIKKLETQAGILKSSIEKLKETRESIRKNIEEVTPKISSEEYSKNIELYNLYTRKKELKKTLNNNKTKIETLEKECNEATIDYEVMRFWEKAFSEQGVIKYVIRNILDYFNTKCNEYLSLLSNGTYSVNFDEELSETIYINGRIIHHCSLSGGQKRRVNLAVMLALQSLLTFTGKTTSNILFLDEITENLDAEGYNGLYILLSALKKEKTIFLITHSEYLKSLLEGSKTLRVTMKNGETKFEC